MKPRILFVSFTADWTGPTHSLSLLIKHLRDRFDMAVLMPGTGKFTDHLRERGINAFCFRSLRKTSIPSVIRLLRKEGVDLVYANSFSSVSKNALVAAKAVRLPTIYHIREMVKPGKWRQTRVLPWAAAVIAISDAAARSAAPFVNRSPLHVVHNGVDVPEVADPTEARAQLRRITQIPADAKVILNVGNVQERKGQHLAIRALGGVLADEPSAHLILIGGLDYEPEYVNQLLELSDHLELQDRVHMLGFRQDVLELISGGDVLLHTPIFEPFGRVLIESMARNIPVVATAVDGVPEIVRDGETGYLVNAGSVADCVAATSRLLSNEALRTSLGQKGRRLVLDRFTAEKTAMEVAKVIEGTLDA